MEEEVGARAEIGNFFSSWTADWKTRSASEREREEGEVGGGESELVFWGWLVEELGD